MQRSRSARLAACALVALALVAALHTAPASACRPCDDCWYEFDACVGDCPWVGGGPEQSCYTACSNALNHCLGYCCL